MGEDKKKSDALFSLSGASLFLGEVRDGLTMLNMQSTFLLVNKGYDEKQVGVMFFVFGMAQFLFQAPSGYIMDYTDRKVLLLSAACVTTTILTLFTAAFSLPDGGNLSLMVFIKFLQGAVTAFIPPGLNSITQGIVGVEGMTGRVSMNEKMNHLGTALNLLMASVIAFFLYPDFVLLFIVSPVACAGVVYFINRIRPEDIDLDAARGMTKKEDDGAQNTTALGGDAINNPIVADSIFDVLRNPKLLVFTMVIFLFHGSNATILALVMQSLAIGNGRSGIVMSCLCIIISQGVMIGSAHICGKYSGKYGRKPLFLIGFFSTPIRCLILTYLVHMRDQVAEAPLYLQLLILSTQVFDGVGAGVFGTMYILVTSDISAGTGRFSLILGITTAAASIGATVSGYVGEALAQDLGYTEAFFILSFTALAPALLYLVGMPETLPSLAKKNQDLKGIASEEESLVQTESGESYDYASVN
uniref:Major facilitator superfamily (MFS) profile domain-containing protein n=1 Tax=Pseudictyota dubia TaxID=2749911 RepID=A0A6U2HCZ6_9STRA|mmetsp:Transcript_47584/g.88329  ORF Transcript_47584/g.88329 Transcript_47584/m.88329 type:complete len:472 (+) Transcript_47584:84-1499(+)